MCSSQPTPHGNWKLAFLLLIATMIFLLKSEPHSFLKTCLLFSALNVAPSIPSQTPPHRKVTGERNKTGGIQHLRATFLKIERGSRFHAVRPKILHKFKSFKSFKSMDVWLLVDVDVAMTVASGRWLRHRLDVDVEMIKHFFNFSTLMR